MLVQVTMTQPVLYRLERCKGVRTGDPLDISGTTVRTIEKARMGRGKPGQLRPHGLLGTRANPGWFRDSRRPSKLVLHRSLLVPVRAHTRQLSLLCPSGTAWSQGGKASERI